jgi:demethoxyubiquinone hydroxylase (CLK1/Coq7/Cat5 family)
MDKENHRLLVDILRMAYSGELAAAYAYRGHWKSVSNADERTRIRQIEEEEWHHRRLVGEMLQDLDERPGLGREIRAILIGRIVGLLCHLSGWFTPMYVAGKLESRNVKEYEEAARLARACQRKEFAECLLAMAEVEWEHERYFRTHVESHLLSRYLPIWPAPLPKEMIRASFSIDH